MQGQTRSYVISSILTRPTSSCLATLAEVKDELSIPSTDESNDARLQRYINEESATIARYCNRVFGLATWQDEFRPAQGIGGEGTRAANNPLKLTKFPLAATAIAFTGNTHLSSLVDGITSTNALEQGMSVFGAGIPAGTSIQSVQPSSILLSNSATMIASAVSLSAGLCVVETVAGTETQLVAGVDFEIDQGSLLAGDEGAACLYRLNEQGNPRTWPSAQILVTYQAGYLLPNDDEECEYGIALPSDLEGTCIRIVVGRFMARSRDPMLRARTQPNMGQEEYWVGAMPGQSGPYPNEIMSVLDRYRQPVIS